RHRVFGKAENLADLADGAAAAIADHGGGKPRALAAVMLVDVLNDLFAPFVLEIDVDIRRLTTLGRNETLEQKISFLGIDLGYGKAIADRRIRRRAAPLAENSL